jgi:signal transduction histidine kinase
VFRTNSYAAIVTAAIMAILFACIIGFFVARALARPIKRITTTASQIRNGDLTARTGLTGTDEIGRLGETFDDMAGTLERDIKLEHRLTSDVAHELRTPLMAMQATVEAMQDGVMPADQDNLATVAVEVRRLSRLVDAMLRLSRMENGKIPLNIERCDVVALASDLVTMQVQLFQDNGLSLEFENETGHRKFIAELDPDLIREAMVNLMSNAMRYTSEGGSVVVRVARDRRNVLLSVQDTGMGIAKEDIPRVFSRFWRSDASREREAGGLGVGLSLTKEIVDRHNGTISVDSEEGVGTTFTLHIPLVRKKTRK